MCLGPPQHVKDVPSGVVFQMGGELFVKMDSPYHSLYPGQDFVSLKDGFHCQLVGYDSPAAREVLLDTKGMA